MATKRICSIEGCGKKHYARGWCDPHYKRYRMTGDVRSHSPIASKTGPDDSGMQEVRRAVAFASPHDCWEWRFSRTTYGYGQVWDGSTVVVAHRVSCTMAHGPPPTKLHQAAHICGNRPCINPHHLRWATRSENEADKIEHGRTNRGERQGSSKLTAVEVDQIRALLDLQSHAQIAKTFMVSRSTVGDIATGRRWGWYKAKAPAG